MLSDWWQHRPFESCLRERLCDIDRKGVVFTVDREHGNVVVDDALERLSCFTQPDDLVLLYTDGVRDRFELDRFEI